MPADVVAMGVPCRVVREIGEHNRAYFQRDRMFDLSVEELTALFTA